MDLLDQMLAEAEADFDVSEQEELERQVAEAMPLSARGAPSSFSDSPSLAAPSTRFVQGVVCRRPIGVGVLNFDRRFFDCARTTKPP